MKSFISNVTEKILQSGVNLSLCKIVIPGKRASLFFKKEFSKNIQKASWLPEFITIEQLVNKISGSAIADNIELLFEFYNVYLSIHKRKNLPFDDFDKFSRWASILLSDFDEIDRYMIDTEQIFNHLSDIEKIENWEPDLQKTELIESYCTFWKHSKTYYQELKNYLKTQNRAWKGLCSRQAAENIDKYVLKDGEHLFFVGFNALSTSEEKIMEHFIKQGRADSFFDCDDFYLNNKQHEAGIFLRRIQKDKKLYRENFSFVEKNLTGSKNVDIYSTVGNVSQNRLVGQIISEKEYFKQDSAPDTAIVLCDEQQLTTMLTSLPHSVDKINVTMGYPLNKLSYSALFLSVVQMHSKAKKQGYSTFYHKDVISVLSQNLMKNLLSTGNFDNASKTISEIISSKKVRLVLDSFPVFAKQVLKHKLSPVFLKVASNSIELNENLIKFAEILRNNQIEKKSDPLESEQLFHFVKILKSLDFFLNKYDFLQDTEVYSQYFKHLLSLESLDFFGEPLVGMQLMGVLETRLLSFKNLIITGLNEGILPKGKNDNTFIPYDVKMYYKLPTFIEKDAVYAYHFYRLLQTAENIHLIYNSEKDSLGSSEESRFIQQIRFELAPYWNVNQNVISFDTSKKEVEHRTEAQKTNFAIEKLTQILKKGISPSSINKYLENPLSFYYEKVLGISPSEEPEEDINSASIGTIIHNTLKSLYVENSNKDAFLTKENFDKMIEECKSVLQNEFTSFFTDRDIEAGKDFIQIKIMQRTLLNYLKEQQKKVESGDKIKVVSLEQDVNCSIKFDKIPFEVVFRGITDKIEINQGVLTIVDYKTGKILKEDLSLENWEQISEKPKALQLMVYALLYCEKNSYKGDFKCCIELVKKYRDPSLFLNIQGRDTITYMGIELFKIQLEKIILEMLDQNIAFIEGETIYYQI